MQASAERPCDTLRRADRQGPGSPAAAPTSRCRSEASALGGTSCWATEGPSPVRRVERCAVGCRRCSTVKGDSLRDGLRPPLTVLLACCSPTGPHFVTALVLLAAAQQLDGDGDHARRTMAAARQMTPSLSIARVEKQFAPHDRASPQWSRIRDILRQAGLPD